MPEIASSPHCRPHRCQLSAAISTNETIPVAAAQFPKVLAGADFRRGKAQFTAHFCSSPLVTPSSLLPASLHIPLDVYYRAGIQRTRAVQPVLTAGGDHEADDLGGTTHIWADYLAKVSKQWAKDVGVATSLNWPVGVGAKGNEGVSGQVGRTPGSIGYVELIYALQNDIKFGLVKNKEGAFIEADLKSVTEAAANSLKDIPDDLRYSITDAPGKASYPISGTVWAVVYQKLPKEKGQMVVDFLRWVIHEGQEYCEALHYARLPKGLVEKADKKLDGIKVEQ
jgi:hypothetical protein